MRYTSYSEVKLFTECPRKWHLRYVRGLRPKKDDAEPPTMRIGSIYHKILANHYNPVITQDERDNRHLEIIAVRPDMQEEALKNLTTAALMFDSYLDWVREEDVDRDFYVGTVESEVAIRDAVKLFGFPFPSRWSWLGFIDMIGVWTDPVHGEVIQLFEHKTTTYTQSTWFASTLRALKEQVHVYCLLLEHIGILKPDQYEVVFNVSRQIQMAKRAAAPLHWRYPYRPSRESLESTREKMATVASHIHKMWKKELATPKIGSAYPVITQACNRCIYNPICPSFDDGSDVERMIEDYYDIRNREGDHGLHDNSDLRRFQSRENLAGKHSSETSSGD